MFPPLGPQQPEHKGNRHRDRIVLGEKRQCRQDSSQTDAARAGPKSTPVERQETQKERGEIWPRSYRPRQQDWERKIDRGRQKCRLTREPEAAIPNISKSRYTEERSQA